MLRRPPVSSLWQSLFLWAENQPEWKEKIRRILGSLTWENRADRLPPDIARALFMPSGKFRGSVTQLEQYRSCPYSYFLKYGMHLQERNDGRMNSADYGSYLHAGLHLFGELFQKQKNSGATLLKRTSAVCPDPSVKPGAKGQKRSSSFRRSRPVHPPFPGPDIPVSPGTYLHMEPSKRISNRSTGETLRR